LASSSHLQSPLGATKNAANEAGSRAIRGASDQANGDKDAADRAGWQDVAAANAAAFAAALITALGRDSGSLTG
jgi:hypothetical protein